jgi:hypothetical protein
MSIPILNLHDNARVMPKAIDSVPASGYVENQAWRSISCAGRSAAVNASLPLGCGVSCSQDNKKE